MTIQLSWIDPATESQRRPSLEAPIALGSDFTQMPGVIGEGRVARMVISGNQVAPYHALITEQDGEWLITDQNSPNGMLINGSRLPSSTLFHGDRIQLGEVQIQVHLANNNSSPVPVASSAGCDRRVGFLVKRRCGRTDSTGCPDCNGGQADYDPYFYDHGYYSGFGNYHSGYWGHHYYSDRDDYSYNPITRSVDFTEADSNAFEQEGDQDYEQDMGAS